MREISEMERIKINKIVAQIISNNFDVNDIELLFIKLREYTQKNSFFEEISHFIAHHHRDSGLTYNLLYRLYCRMRFFMEYQVPKNKNKLDLYSSLDKYIYDLFLNETKNTHSKEFKNKYGFTRAQAISKVKQSFINQKNNKYLCQNPNSTMLINIIQFISSKINIQSLTTLDKIIKELIQSLKNNNFVFDEKQFANNDKLKLAILILMHKREFYTNDNYLGKSYLTIQSNNFGKLQNINIIAIIKLPNLDISISLINTNFDCTAIDNSLIKTKELSNGLMWKSFDDKANLTLSKESLKIIKLRL